MLSNSCSSRHCAYQSNASNSNRLSFQLLCDGKQCPARTFCFHDNRSCTLNLTGPRLSQTLIKLIFSFIGLYFRHLGKNSPTLFLSSNQLCISTLLSYSRRPMCFSGDLCSWGSGTLAYSPSIILNVRLFNLDISTTVHCVNCSNRMRTNCGAST